MFVGRCWTSCNLFPIRNLAVSQHVSSIVRFFIFFQSFPTFFFVILFIIFSSVLEQAGFSEMEGVISSNPKWQCLVCFARNINSRACLKYTFSLFWLLHRCDRDSVSCYCLKQTRTPTKLLSLNFFTCTVILLHKKSNLHYTRRISPKRVTSGGSHLRGSVPGLHSSEETSQRWRAVGDTVPI